VTGKAGIEYEDYEEAKTVFADKVLKLAEEEGVVLLQVHADILFSTFMYGGLDEAIAQLREIKERGGGIVAGIIREEMMIPMDGMPDGKGSKYQREDKKWVSGFDRKFVPEGVQIVKSPVFGIDAAGDIHNGEEDRKLDRVMHCNDRKVPGDWVIDEATMDDEARGVFVNLVMEMVLEAGIPYIRMVRVRRFEHKIDGKVHPRVAVSVNGCGRYGEGIRFIR